LINGGVVTFGISISQLSYKAWKTISTGITYFRAIIATERQAIWSSRAYDYIQYRSACSQHVLDSITIPTHQRTHQRGCDAIDNIGAILKLGIFQYMDCLERGIVRTERIYHSNGTR
jgi:hypothetical protein